MSGLAWAIVLSELFAASFSLQASRRLLVDVFEQMYGESRSEGVSPVWSRLVQRLEHLKAMPMTREGQYRAAVLFCAKCVQRELGPALGHVSSDFFAKMQEFDGCLVIRTDQLSAQVATFLVGVFLHWAYEDRARRREEAHRRLVFAVDDALALVKGSTYTDTQELNPLSNLALMARSKNIGFVIGAQDYSLVSPALRGNCDTHIVCGAYGKDAEEVARDMNLTEEQEAELPLLRPGEAVVLARSTWPKAVRGRFPRIP